VPAPVALPLTPAENVVLIAEVRPQRSHPTLSSGADTALPQPTGIGSLLRPAAFGGGSRLPMPRPTLVRGDFSVSRTSTTAPLGAEVPVKPLLLALTLSLLLPLGGEAKRATLPVHNCRLLD
jgi:hypothetical protein